MTVSGHSGMVGFSRLLVLGIVAAGCGGKVGNSDAPESGGFSDGGATSQSTWPAKGGWPGSGGLSSGALSTTPTASEGGASAIGKGGTSAIGKGGTSAIGKGGTSAIGKGGTSTIGKGGAVGSGGTSVAAGAAFYAGGTQSTGTGGNASGSGGIAPATNAGMAGLSGVAGASAIPLTEFCTGGEVKVSYQGKNLSPPVTSFNPPLMRSCCFDYGVSLHSYSAFGFDLELNLASVAGAIDVGETVLIPGKLNPYAVSLRRADGSSPAGHNAIGTVRQFSRTSSVAPWDVGLCIEISGSDYDDAGARVYVPRVTFMPHSSNNRFQIYTLSDSTITTIDAEKLPLGSLGLATQPLVDLSSITCVEKSTQRIGIHYDPNYGASLPSLIGKPSMQGIPFVVVADDVRIYLGSFTSPVSSIGTNGPEVDVGKMTAYGFVIAPPRNGSDPRLDERILKVLGETYRLVP